MISFETRLGAEAEGRRALGVKVSVQPATIGSIWGSLPTDEGGGLRPAKWDEGRFVPLLHAYGDLGSRGNIRIERLRQRARSQICARWSTVVLMGQFRHESRLLRHHSQHLLRRRGLVYVADRENHRIQVFDGDGRYESQWNNLHRPCGLFMEPRQNGAFYISKLGPFMAINRDLPNVGPRISILAHDGPLPIF